MNEGDGAFYGPKIDIAVTDAMGREHQVSSSIFNYLTLFFFSVVFLTRWHVLFSSTLPSLSINSVQRFN
jgi:hypothetical protein